MNNSENIKKFCSKVKNGLGTILDSQVKKEYTRVYEADVNSYDLAFLLAVLEQNNLLDKDHSVNKKLFFYRQMYQKLVNTAEAASKIKTENG
jgi:hypothetical protein